MSPLDETSASGRTRGQVTVVYPADSRRILVDRRIHRFVADGPNGPDSGRCFDRCCNKGQSSAITASCLPTGRVCVNIVEPRKKANGRRVIARRELTDSCATCACLVISSFCFKEKGKGEMKMRNKFTSPTSPLNYRPVHYFFFNVLPIIRVISKNAQLMHSFGARLSRRFACKG